MQQGSYLEFRRFIGSSFGGCIGVVGHAQFASDSMCALSSGFVRASPPPPPSCTAHPNSFNTAELRDGIGRYFLNVVRSRTHQTSRLSDPTVMGKSDVFFTTGRFVLPTIHFLISECPSANEKPHAPLWDELGRSLQAVSSTGLAAVQKTKNPSLMLSGCSSKKT